MARKRIQWHPLFTRLLRSRIERYYEIRTGVMVGDLPRQADLVLLRRRHAGRMPVCNLMAAFDHLELAGVQGTK